MRISVLVAALLLGAGLFILVPHNIPDYTSRPNPALDYEQALSNAEKLRENEPQGMDPLCRLQLMTHGGKTVRAVTLVHGYTSCPQQFHELGKRLHASGMNVLIAPLPHHGLLDRMTGDHSLLRTEELMAYADAVVDIAGGLGEKVVMMGISAGGVVTAQAAQHRADIDLAVIISPAFGFRKIPTFLTAAAMNIASIMPDVYTWWNPISKAEAPPSYGYPRYSRHALSQILRLGFAVQEDIKQHPPKAKEIVMVFNPNDDQINNELTRDILQRWKSYASNITTYEFDASLELGHDLIDPNLPEEKTDVVYPKLIELVNH